MGKTEALQSSHPRQFPLGWLLPVGATFLLHVILRDDQGGPLLFLPQFLAYGWMLTHRGQLRVPQIGLTGERIGSALGVGAAVGFLLGGLNLWVILQAAPWLGWDPSFLRETPHARLPFWVMFPFGIVFIAVFVETNFRGWFFAELREAVGMMGGKPIWTVLGSALLFSFDPFMVATFGVFHWLALSDGIVWGLLRLKMQSLWSPIAAHTVEVWLSYGVLKLFYA